MKGYMYILKCSDDSYYTGSTKDLEIRLEQHQNGEGANHTRKRLPIELVYFEEFDRVDEAFHREKQVQGWSRKKKEALINSDFDKLSHLSRNYAQHGASAGSAADVKMVPEPNPVHKCSAVPELVHKCSAVPELVEGKTPKIRFPEFKNEWEQKPLNHYLAESKKTNTDLKYDKSQVLSVSGELGCVNQIEHLGRSYAGASVHNYGVVKKGDIVYTKSPLKANPYGIIRLNKGKAGIVSTLYAVYKVKTKDATGEFLDYYFSLDANTNRYLRPLVKKGAKNDMKINNAYVLHDEIFAPSIPEQKRIASFLTVTDKRLAQLKEKKALLEEYKKGMMQQIFSKELRFKDDNGKEFPEWEMKKFGEIFSFRTTNSFSRDNLNYEEGFVKNIHYGDIHTKFNSHFEIEKEEVPFIKSNIELQKISKNNYLKEGDIIIADASEDYEDIGKCIEILSINNEIVLAGLHTIHARPDLQKTTLGFFGHLMKSAKIRLQIKTIAQGSKVLSLSATRLSKIEVLMASLSEQKKIANFLSGIDHKISTCQSKIEQTQAYKKSLLQQMFCV